MFAFCLLLKFFRYASHDMSIGYIVAIVMSPLRAGLGPWSSSCKIVLVVKSLLVYHSIV